MGQNCSDLLQKGGKTQGKLFQNRGKWRIFCTKKGASDECFIKKGGACPLIVALYKCYFISESVYLLISATSSVLLYYQCYFI